MKKFVVLVTVTVLFLPAIIFADTPAPAQSVTGAQITGQINQIYRISLGLAALLALMMMVLGGYYYMTAAGNAERSGKGVDMIMSSMLGIAILFGAYLLLNTINPDLVNLKLKDFNDYTVPTNTNTPTNTQQQTQPPSAPRN